MITLRAMLAHSPALFYPQTWYAKETFLDTPDDAVATPKGIERVGLSHPARDADVHQGDWHAADARRRRACVTTDVVGIAARHGRYAA